MLMQRYNNITTSEAAACTLCNLCSTRARAREPSITLPLTLFHSSALDENGYTMWRKSIIPSLIDECVTRAHSLPHPIRSRHARLPCPLPTLLLTLLQSISAAACAVFDVLPHVLTHNVHTTHIHRHNRKCRMASSCQWMWFVPSLASNGMSKRISRLPSERLICNNRDNCC